MSLKSGNWLGTEGPSGGCLYKTIRTEGGRKVFIFFLILEIFFPFIFFCILLYSFIYSFYILSVILGNFRGGRILEMILSSALILQRRKQALNLAMFF